MLRATLSVTLLFSLCAAPVARGSAEDDAKELAYLENTVAPAQAKKIADALKSKVKISVGEGLKRRPTSLCRYVADRALPFLSDAVQRECADAEACKHLAAQLRAVVFDLDNSKNRTDFDHDEKTGTLRIVLSEYGYDSFEQGSYRQMMGVLVTTDRERILKNAPIGPVTPATIDELAGQVKGRVSADVLIDRLLQMRTKGNEKLWGAIDAALARVLQQRSGYFGSPVSNKLATWVPALLASEQVDGELKAAVMQAVEHAEEYNSSRRADLGKLFPRKELGLALLPKKALRAAVIGPTPPHSGSGFVPTWFLKACAPDTACVGKVVDAALDEAMSETERVAFFNAMGDHTAKPFIEVLANRLDTDKPKPRSLAASAWITCREVNGQCYLESTLAKRVYAIYWKQLAQGNADPATIALLASLDNSGLKRAYPILRKDPKTRLPPAALLELAKKYPGALLKLEFETRSFLDYEALGGEALGQAVLAILDIKTKDGVHAEDKTHLLYSLIDEASSAQVAVIQAALDKWVKKGVPPDFELERVSERIDTRKQKVATERPSGKKGKTQGKSHGSDLNDPF